MSFINVFAPRFCKRPSPSTSPKELLSAATGKVDFDILTSEYDPNKIMGDIVLRKSNRLLKAAEPGWLYIDDNTHDNLITSISKKFITPGSPIFSGVRRNATQG